ncbi:hypothetical protein E3Q16_00806 [Wallemia mellicola]|uniref:DH domain-containing protein n=1 Tax=Wallemia mellicola TaxID=1708541 RepID=A0AB38MYE5_9BASI|nr:hypothetical protein E3Q24_00198 [Wallemia mellicola]TIC06942.1 hypothetical protein E3Q16_00806 [Wallemia mellicola]TIC26852.1 hypothetical protein E3Q12_00093 [Wallemia mellicola]TIC69429.1 hypothetical protein E3Q02_00869 [Wallemia mellicola]TIC71837.1 hypothetical protein E3Q03_00150 [Wallemia mellicola]
MNPLNDLIETEKKFVEDMAIIVRKVASAWSRSNFPPPEIDRMFRIIESVYRINRSFLNNLLSTNNNYKLIGDSLLNFIKDFQSSYDKYVQLYTSSPPFSKHKNIQENDQLHQILASMDRDIDELFELPAKRLKYYLNLYKKLLTSTNPSKPDYNLLKDSVETLQRLVDLIDNSTINKLTSSSTSLSHQPTVRFNPEDPLKLRAKASNDIQSDDSSISTISQDDQDDIDDETDNNQNNSDDTASIDSHNSTMNKRESPPIPEAQLKAVDLSERLDTSRTLDIFTMQQKKCKLQIQPPQLPFKRELRRSADVVLSFTPSAAPQSTQEIVMRRAHIFLLSDLFLVAERMTANEKEAGVALPGTDMWLSFPPLSGKFLKATQNKQENAFDLGIMNKETLTIKVESTEARDSWIQDISNCTQFAFNGTTNKPPPSDQLQNLNLNAPPAQISSSQTSSPQFPNPPPRDHLPPMENVPTLGSQFERPPPPHVLQNNQLTANNLSNIPGYGPQPAQIRPIRPGMIPPPPPPFDTLPPRLQQNDNMNRMPSLDTINTNSTNSNSNSNSINGGLSKYAMPSNLMGQFKTASPNTKSQDEDTPPPSPTEIKPTEPEKIRMSAQMRCKVFIKHGHQAWKSLGSGGLKLFTQSPQNKKQLVVESDKAKSLLISNYVLLDAVERVGKTGLAVEMSDNGQRTGVIYLLQLKSDQSAKGLFDELVKGSSRDANRR